jgi:hypothetical protein
MDGSSRWLLIRLGHVPGLLHFDQRFFRLDRVTDIPAAPHVVYYEQIVHYARQEDEIDATGSAINSAPTTGGGQSVEQSGS